MPVRGENADITCAAANAGGKPLNEKLDQEYLYLPMSSKPEKIRENMKRLAKTLGIAYGATPLDFSVNGSVLSMRELLEENGHHVRWHMGHGKPAGEAGDGGRDIRESGCVVGGT